MNLNATCKDILEVCSCSSLYLCLLLVVLRIPCSAEGGEQKAEPTEPKIPIFIPLQMSLQLLLSVLAQGVVVGLGRGTSIPLIWGLLGAFVIQALLPSELCQDPGTEFTVVLKKIIASQHISNYLEGGFHLFLTTDKSFCGWSPSLLSQVLDYLTLYVS